MNGHAHAAKFHQCFCCGNLHRWTNSIILNGNLWCTRPKCRRIMDAINRGESVILPMQPPTPQPQTKQ